MRPLVEGLGLTKGLEGRLTRPAEGTRAAAVSPIADTQFHGFGVAATRRMGDKGAVCDALQHCGNLPMLADILKALVLGIVEGVTEFLPVSSTGHLLLVERFMDLDQDNFWKTFAVMIQLGAILAILVIYFGRLWRIAVGMFSDPAARRFVIGVLLAFLPAVILGLLLGSFIKNVLFNPWVVCFSLIAGGAVLLWVDQQDLNPRYHDATTFSLPMYLGIGIAQCAAMIPGVSRSGASIVAAMLFGADKRAAAEFSFFLAIPTMVGAFAYDFYKNRADMTMDHGLVIAVGFVMSFITAIIVVKTFLDYVTRRGFALFAWWRVIVGSLGLIALALGK
jgi:undecaprenyl-diphosphatase